MGLPDFTIEVALPVPFRHSFTYEVPQSLRPQVNFGSRVIVPFHKRRLVGVVTAIEGRPVEAAEFEIKPIVEVLEGGAVLTTNLYELCLWVADYYFAPIGEVLRAACPLAFTSSTRQFVQLTVKGTQRIESLDHTRRTGVLFNEEAEEPLDLQLLRAVAAKGTWDRRRLLQKFTGPPWDDAYSRLRASGEVRVSSERSKSAVKGKEEWYVRLSSAAADEDSHRRLSPGQRKILEYLNQQQAAVPLKELILRVGISTPTIRTLAKRDLVVLERRHVDRTPLELVAPGSDGRSVRSQTPPLELNADQKRALRIIEEAIGRRSFSTVLLYGVTASGKTEVYLRAIERVLAEGGTALMLVPEIALTPGTSSTFAARFPNKVAILHSALSEGERYDEWWRIKNGEARVVIGTRSAVFAPLENLRLVVVDEEHDGSYKQQESPRYHGRDVAVVRAKMSQAIVLLGSATPSMESFYNSQRGKYQLIALKHRVESRELAQVKVVDMRTEFKESKKNEMLSRDLLATIEARLRANEQVLVLLNRRGFSSFVLCRACGSTRQCPNCSITMTYHKRRHILLCHYCAAVAAVPKKCWQCESEHLYFVGGGTEQVEEKLRDAFPPARIARLDRDTAQGRGSYHRILGEFSEGVTDILVGTQMIAKGHDFPRVTLVGVLNADGALSFPDFRAAERTFQLLTQVAGRSGRGTTPGEVLLQAFYPEHYAIRCATRQNFIEFYNKEIHFRRMMHYPPFGQLALVGIRHREFNEAMKLAKALGEHLRANPLPEVRVLGPAIAPLARLKQDYRWQLLLKSSRRQQLKDMIERCLEFCEREKIQEPNVFIDVDPTNMM